MRVVWQRQRIPKAWRRAGGVLKPKEKGASDISQFRPICLLDVKGKIFFSIVAQRQDSLAAWSIQAWSGTKSKQPRRTRETYMWFSLTWPMLLAQFPIIFSGNLSTSSMYQNISQHWSRPISKTYNCALQQPTTWQRLEVGIMAGYRVLPLVFTMAMEVIIRASKWVVGRERARARLHLPPIRAYMDDMTTLTTTEAHTKQLLGKLQENIKWAQMKIKQILKHLHCQGGAIRHKVLYRGRLNTNSVWAACQKPRQMVQLKP